MCNCEMKQYLEHVRESVKNVNFWRDAANRQRARLELTGYSFSGMPGNPNTSCDAIGRGVSDYLDIIEMLEEQAAFEAMLVKQATEALIRMSLKGDVPVRLIRIVARRYCYDDDYETIAKAEGKAVKSIRNDISDFFKIAEINNYVPMDAA